MANREVFVRSPYNYDADAASVESGISFPLDDEEAPIVVQQQFKEECDINTIVKRFGLTGELPENLNFPKSGDFTGVTDFHTAMNVVRRAEEEFMELPAELRSRFGNDPGTLLAFLEDPKNKEDAIKLGLVNKPVEVARDMVTAIDELAAKLVPKP